MVDLHSLVVTPVNSSSNFALMMARRTLAGGIDGVFEGIEDRQVSSSSRRCLTWWPVGCPKRFNAEVARSQPLHKVTFYLAFINMSEAQFTLYSHLTGPNGWKVTYLLNELGLSYNTVYVNTKENDHKKPPYLALNPNGRMPTLVDHKNGDFTVWESSAILLYIVDKYDTEKRFTVTSEEDRYHLYQWLFFQASGQGPYYGQSYWFNHIHPEKIPSAQERYKNETRRVLGVLESVLLKQEWLVGGKLTIADLTFVPWHNSLKGLLGEEFDFEKGFPATYRWHTSISALPGVKAGNELKARLMTH
ncbi:Glutathione S-transferase 2 [Steccherinum ochraceum]|uniref:glutathione transferase n=1 Tax=Steccherinum ochraceum TaxID=92696 RepID=A0A4R0RLS6_9APHY|nr:Glutathione S-transferase 2 [Steccherinum ochraceum]